MPFKQLDLAVPILKTIDKLGYREPTAIQSKAIPLLRQNRDMMGIAQTGGGKTAAFIIPLVEKLVAEQIRPRPRHPRAIILVPTRELAGQIGETARLFCRGMGLYQTVIYGGAPFRPQMNALQRGVDILVSTPGRLLDHIERGNIIFDDCTSLILDEADRMLDMGFIDDVRKIALMLDTKHQTIMFSATMNPVIRKLASDILKNPVRVEIARKVTVAASIDHRVLFVAKNNKKKLLRQLLENEALKRVLIFTRTRADADHLVLFLESLGKNALAIHGDKTQRLRERSLQAFKKGKIDILVATDVAARGIDVKGITHVINFALPLEAENYVHRVGRTGRAGQTGVALSFCDAGERSLLREIENFIRHPVRLDKDHPFHLDIDAKIAPAARGRGKGKAVQSTGKKHKGSSKKGGKTGRSGKGFFAESGNFATKKGIGKKPKRRAAHAAVTANQSGMQPLLRK